MFFLKYFQDSWKKMSVEVKNGKNRYKPGVLENNWYEDRSDYTYLKQDQPLNFVTILKQESFFVFTIC